MYSDRRGKYVRPHIRFWCRGQIAVSARIRIDQLINTKHDDAQSMIEEWIL